MNLRELAKIEINCDLCNFNYTYADTVAHQSECRKPKFQCILNCGAEQIFRDETSWEDHAKSECSKMILTCNICSSNVPRQSCNDHECQQTLITSMADMKDARALFQLYEDLRVEE